MRPPRSGLQFRRRSLSFRWTTTHMTFLSPHRASDALKVGLWLQCIAILLLSSTFTDRWHVLEICVAALIGFWSTVLFIWFRRMDGFTKRDHSFFLWGYPAFLVVFWLAARFFFLWRHYVV
jgi:hypothetical protein